MLLTLMSNLNMFGGGPTPPSDDHTGPALHHEDKRSEELKEWEQLRDNINDDILIIISQWAIHNN